MKLAITFWGTQKYLEFLPEWYERLEDKFVSGIYKKYFVFTDGDLENSPDNVVKIEIPHYGFPTTYNKTFEELLKLEKDVFDYDWLVSIDADLYACDVIEYDDFFDETKKYFSVHHPCHKLGMPPHNQKPGSYDVNKKSNAFIGDDIMDMGIYYQGCLWGGKIPYVFDMIRQIDKWTQEDVSKNIQARFYEESYLNKWFLMYRDEVNTLPPEYAFPEVFEQYVNGLFPKKMIHLQKNNKSFKNNQW